MTKIWKKVLNCQWIMIKHKNHWYESVFYVLKPVYLVIIRVRGIFVNFCGPKGPESHYFKNRS